MNRLKRYLNTILYHMDTRTYLNLNFWLFSLLLFTIMCVSQNNTSTRSYGYCQHLTDAFLEDLNCNFSSELLQFHSYVQYKSNSITHSVNAKKCI